MSMCLTVVILGSTAALLLAAGHALSAIARFDFLDGFDDVPHQRRDTVSRSRPPLRNPKVDPRLTPTGSHIPTPEIVPVTASRRTA